MASQRLVIFVELSIAVLVAVLCCCASDALSASTTNTNSVFNDSSVPREPRKRVKRDAITIAATLSNVLGIVVSPFFPAYGALPLLIGTMLPVLFSGGSGDAIRLFQDMILDERARQQERILAGYRERLTSIKHELERQDGRANVRWARDDLRNMYGDMVSVRCQFMHIDDHPEKSAVYFTALAKLHLSVNQLMRYEFADEAATWQEHFIKYAKDYVRYARYVYRFMTYKQELRHNMESVCKAITDWTKALPASDQNEVRYENAVRNNDVVAFKRPWTLNWLSCWGSGSWCKYRSCPGGNPNERGSQYEYWWKCRGEIFFLQLASESASYRQYVRHGNHVGIKYSSMHGQQWWLSADHKNGRDTTVRTLSCPGELGGWRLARGECASERWQIVGDTCDTGEVLLHGANVNLLNDINPYITLAGERRSYYGYHGYGAFTVVNAPYSTIPPERYLSRTNFEIFRADVDRDSDTVRLLCK